MSFVEVGNPANPSDVTGYGSVSYAYSIGKYEVTIGQYAEFLNAKARTDAFSLWNDKMDSINGSPFNRGISRTGSPGSYVYTPIGTPGRPVAMLNWLSMARFANWMNNGRANGDTETGAYTINQGTISNATLTNDGQGRITASGSHSVQVGDHILVSGVSGVSINGAYIVTAVNGSQISFTGSTWSQGIGVGGTFAAVSAVRNIGSQVWIPSANEWYKAAYYDPSGRYWAYAMQSDAPPGNTIGGQGPQANHSNSTVSASLREYNTSTGNGQYNRLTDVGAFVSSVSPYGTFDQSGNVSEATEEFSTVWLGFTPNATRVARGGDYGDPSGSLASISKADMRIEVTDSHTGFRLAAVAVPEPSTLVMGAVGIACGGFSMWRRRKRA
jgi:formylglycine-generating enzyme required for sulfatase activity